MRLLWFQLILSSALTNAVVIDGKRPRKFISSSSSSDSSSDSSHEFHRHHHGKGKGRPRPPPHPSHPKTTSKPTPTCPPGWTLFNRQMGPWCVKLHQGALNQEQAESSCRAQGAVLSSIENAEERATLASLGLNVMLPTGWKFGTIRTGLRRNFIGSPWYTTDQFTTGMNGIVWSPGEPNNGAYQGRPNNCGQLWLWVPGGKQEGKRVHGTFFAMQCEKSTPDRWRGFLCGKRAT